MILLTSADDIDILKKYSDYQAYSESYAIMQIHPEEKLKYFLSFSDPSIDLDELVEGITTEWYRNEKSFDVFQAKEVSIGGMLNYSLAVSISSIIRYYFALKECLVSYEKILIASNAPDTLKSVAMRFPGRIEFYSSSGYSEHTTSFPDRNYVANPPIFKWHSLALRFLQLPFYRALKGKLLVFNDWTFDKLDNKNYLNINKFNPYRTFCLRFGCRYAKLANNIFQNNLEVDIIKKNIERVLFQVGVDNDVYSDLSQLFINNIRDTYKDRRQVLINLYCSYLECFNTYKPSMVIFPSATTPSAQVVFGIARARGIPTAYMQDGFSFIVHRQLLPKDKYNNKIMMDYYLSQSRDSDIQLNNIFGDQVSVLKVSPAILNTHNKASSKSDKNCVIVIFPYGSLHSPYCRWDQQYKYVTDSIDTLILLGYSNIKVKMKMGFEVFEKERNELMKEILLKSYNGNVEMIFGYFSKYLKNSKLIVGSISSAIIESIHSKAQYYIYEPKSLGLTDKAIDSLISLENKQISRDLKDLKANISNKNFVKIDLQDSLKREDINDIDFNKIAQGFSRKKN